MMIVKNVKYDIFKIMCSVLFAFAMIFVPDSISAAKENAEIISYIPKEGMDYFNSNYKSMLKCITEDESVEIDISKVETGVPYVDYIIDEIQNPIYHFPMIYKDKIIYVIDLSESELGYVLAIGTDFVDELNQIDYQNKEYIFYQEDGELIAENEDGKIKIYSNDGVKNFSIKNAQFYAKSFRAKKEAIYNKINDYVLSDKEDNPDTKNLMGKQLTLHNPRGQYTYNMCWASTVATIVNYRTDSAYTGFDVCNRIGRGYDAGGSIYHMQDAMSVLGVKYPYIKGSALTYSEVKKNIDAGYPFAAGGDNGGTTVGHVVTIYGYKTVDNTKKILTWNSALQNGAGGKKWYEYNKGIIGTAGGKTYAWDRSLYKKK